MERFHNLTELLAVDRAAHAYFDGLPAGIRQHDHGARRACLHSPAELQRLRGKAAARGSD